jgi:hypothetical protein
MDKKPWVTFNPLTHTYDTPDATKLADALRLGIKALTCAGSHAECQSLEVYAKEQMRAALASYEAAQAEAKPADECIYPACRHNGCREACEAKPGPAPCTCPSGDGSLRWPCPAHPSEAKPAVEPPAWRYKYKFRDIGETGAYEYHSHEFACIAGLPRGEPLYTHAAPSAPAPLTDAELALFIPEPVWSHTFGMKREALWDLERVRQAMRAAIAAIKESK